MEKITQDWKLMILKIIEKQPGIHHGLLLKTISEKELMAKKTAEKNITSLINDKKIISCKYGKKILYVLSDGELSHKDLKKKISMIIKKLKNELESIDKEFDRFDYETKRAYPDYLIRILGSISKEKDDLSKYEERNKGTDTSFVKEIFDEICDLTNNSLINDKTAREKRADAIKIRNRLNKMEKDDAGLREKRYKMRSSKSKNILTLKMIQMDSDISESYKRLEIIRDELKSMNKNG